MWRANTQGKCSFGRHGPWSQRCILKVTEPTGRNNQRGGAAAGRERTATCSKFAVGRFVCEKNRKNAKKMPKNQKKAGTAIAASSRLITHVKGYNGVLQKPSTLFVEVGTLCGL